MLRTSHKRYKFGMPFFSQAPKRHFPLRLVNGGKAGVKPPTSRARMVCVYRPTSITYKHLLHRMLPSRGKDDALTTQDTVQRSQGDKDKPAGRCFCSADRTLNNQTLALMPTHIVLFSADVF